MARNITVTTGLTVAIIFATVLLATVTLPTVEASLQYLGYVEGKNYFAESAVAMNWTNAKDLCSQSGMRLASITSATQNTFLKNSYHASTFPSSTYWTAGRDARTISRFAWDFNGEAPIASDAVDVEFAATIDRLVCLGYRNANRTENDQFYATTCATSYRVLCEIAVSRNIDNQI